MKLRIGRFTFDTDTRELLEGSRRIHLSPKAFDLLQLLLERRPNVVTKSELQDRIWAGTFVGEANLSVVVAEVRQALADDSKDAAFVRTVHRVGYAFCGVATEAAAGDSPAGAAAFSGCWLVWQARTFPLVTGDNVIGRDPRCTIWLDASGVSKRHACIAIVRGQAILEDLDSSNGTFVGGVRITEPRTLSDGDVIEFGAAAVSFRMWSDEQPPKTERIAGPRRRSSKART
jgi:DNA-binding winged helix-turn-helix (wHTH) protein